MMERVSNKWMATVASMWIQCSCGVYTFSVYSSVLKSSQGYDQSTLETMAVFIDIGSIGGVLAGLLYSAVTNGSNHSGFGGPWVVLLAGATQNFLGYFLTWASVVGLIKRPPVPLMCLFMYLSSQSMPFYNTANTVSGVQNFPDYSGTIVGIMKGFSGISGAVLLRAYNTLYEGEPSKFILMLALLPTLISLVLMLLVKIYKTNTGDDKKHLNGFVAVALIIAGYLMIIIILENIFSIPLWTHRVTFILLLLLLASPLGIAIRAQNEDSKRVLETLSFDSNPLRGHPELLRSSDSSVPEDMAYHELPSGALDDKVLFDEEGMNLLQAMCTVNFWLLFIATICGKGSTMAVINNLSQMGQSLNYTSVEVNNLVSLWSIWDCLGRVGAGYLSDYLLHTRGWARPLLMAITLATMIIGLIVIASGFPRILYVGSILIGICDGSLGSLIPTITSDIFGVRHMGTIFSAITLASPVGFYIFSVKLIGYIYDKEAGGDDHSCFGTRCFMLSLLIMASLDLLGFLLAIALFIRTKRFYSLRRLKDSVKWSK
ncbi:protein NUCLEAR FUSION DEFECTIVE 4-like [Quercus robur]|uniref:protein NUCLEAR FUSION DEFECTIVE 4-like n=1 Tax=Quercus robur TaxID=38942 RepID=UPI002163F905|nr:protein NUCLEAR FUSION DEFECTIVE 4-like [Quercus robur]